jgi:hypothetical protein
MHLNIYTVPRHLNFIQRNTEQYKKICGETTILTHIKPFSFHQNLYKKS